MSCASRSWPVISCSSSWDRKKGGWGCSLADHRHPATWQKPAGHTKYVLLSPELAEIARGAPPGRELSAAVESDGQRSGTTLGIYLQLTEVEQAFKELKGDLAIRPIYHQNDARIEA